MRPMRLVAGVCALVVVLAACGSSDPGAAKTVMPDVVGKKLDVAKADIEKAGIDEEVEVDSDATFGVVKESNWTVCEQTPAAGEAVTAAPRLTVDRSCGDDDGEANASVTTAPATTAAPTGAPTTTEAPATTAAKPADEVLTQANSPDLAALLAGHDCDDSVGSFAAKYRDRTIEFDGFLGAMAPHDGAQTRFDLLINAGDFDPNKAFGPNFQFRDVNLVYDLHLTGTNVPDTLGIGQNLHVIAKVGEFDSFTCLFQLTPVATSVR